MDSFVIQQIFMTMKSHIILYRDKKIFDFSITDKLELSCRLYFIRDIL